MLRLVMSRKATFAVDVLAWGLLHSATGILAHRLGPERLDHDAWRLQPRRFEDEGQWYRRHLAITRWKDRLPEAGDLFPGGTSKRHLPTSDDPGLRLFVRETRRAELGHWWALGAGSLFVLWNPPLASALLVAYGVGINLPFIAVQRYNRLRAQALLSARSRSGHLGS